MGLFLDNQIAGLPGIALTLILSYGFAIGLWPLLRILGPRVTAAFASIEMFFPLFIPADLILARALTMFVSVDLLFKMIDYSRCCRKARGGSFVDYLKFLVPFPPLLVMFQSRTRGQPKRVTSREVLRFLCAAGLCALAYSLARLANTVAIVQSSFPLDHAIKLVLFVIAVESLSRLINGIERMAGYDIRPLVDSAYLSRTVGEFWWRYNTRVHAWLDQNVFRRSGGLRSPVRSIFVTFFVSAIFHEVGFGIATSRFDGYQFTFFMLQAPAVLGSAKLKDRMRGWGATGATVLRLTTISWFAVSSIFFFHGMNRVFPWFYASQPWLP